MAVCGWRNTLISVVPSLFIPVIVIRVTKDDQVKPSNGLLLGPSARARLGGEDLLHVYCKN